MAAREFGASAGWQDWEGNGWLVDDLKWRPDPSKKGTAAEWSAERDRAWAVVRAEIVELQQLMEDDRAGTVISPRSTCRRTGSPTTSSASSVQAQPGTPGPSSSLVVASRWATSRICSTNRNSSGCAHRRCAQDSSNRFGPPAHPAFPSGHSFLGHLIALLLLEIPALHQRYGIFPNA